MDCPACGGYVPDTAGFCRGCGTILRGSKGRTFADPAAGTPPTRAGQSVSPPTQPPPLPTSAMSGAYGAPPYGAQPYGAPPYGAQPYGAPPYGAQPPTQPYGAQPYGAPRPAQAVTGRDRLSPLPTEAWMGVATVIMGVSLFLPFYRLTFTCGGVDETLGSVNALSGYSGGWRFADLGLCALVVLFVVARYAAGLRVPEGATPGIFGLMATIGNLALMTLVFFSVPLGGFQVGFAGCTAQIAQAWAAFVALSAGILAVTAAAATVVKERSIGRMPVRG